MPNTAFDRPSNTKIVSTVGPAIASVPMLTKLLKAGVDVFRINAAHGNTEQFANTLEMIRAASREAKLPVGVLMDLGGPKIRLGKLPGDEMELQREDRLKFVRGLESTGPNTLTCTYERLIEELEVGDRIVLADGTVSLTVVAKTSDSAECEVVQPGILRSRQGVNLPGVKLSIPAMLDIDRTNAAWAAKNGIDFLGLSFVRNAVEINDLKLLIAENGGHAQVVAKIEKPEALVRLEEIVLASDAVMVARGDLGVETDIAAVPMVQKHIIAMCRKHCKPVIVATQMLESMTRNSLPTRAEATDIANAILDGADACMLSEETAVGNYPAETVAMMHRIAIETEKEHCPGFRKDRFSLEKDEQTVSDAAFHASGYLAETLDAKMIIVTTKSGETARRLSKCRFGVSTIGMTCSEITLRRLCLYWGVIPMLIPEGATGPEAVMKLSVQAAKDAGEIKEGDRVVLLGEGSAVNHSPRHNLILVHEV